MASSDAERQAFAEAWLAQQRRFWEAMRGQQAAPGYRHAQAQWSQACERWWSAVVGSTPPSLKPVLDAALDHTRLCLELGVQMAEGQTAEALGSWLLSPERLFQAAASAMGQEHVTGADPSDGAQVQALAEAMTLLARVARATLEAVRNRLGKQAPESPADLLDIYIEEIEAHYLAVAASDEFARVAGRLVNTWVDAEAERLALQP
jgi:hypothetical protein